MIRHLPRHDVPIALRRALVKIMQVCRLFQNSGYLPGSNLLSDAAVQYVESGGAHKCLEMQF